MLKKFARWILKDEIQKLYRLIREANETIQFHSQEETSLRLQVKHYVDLMSMNESVFLSQSMLKTIIDVLPDPNMAAIDGVISKRPLTYLTLKLSSGEIKIPVRILSFTKKDDNVIYAKIKIDKLGYTIYLPIKYEVAKYNIMGCNSEITTNYWDLNFSNIKVIPDETFIMLCEFVIAQRKVLSDC